MPDEPQEQPPPEVKGFETRLLTGSEAVAWRTEREALNLRIEETRVRFRETGMVPGPSATELAAVAAASERIGRDLLRTTSRQLELAPFEVNGDTVVCIWVDDQRRGWFQYESSEPDDVEDAVAAIADKAREHTLDEEIWGGWPICPRHGTHPLEAVLSEGQAVWGCIGDGTVVARIGDLQTVG